MRSTSRLLWDSLFNNNNNNNNIINNNDPWYCNEQAMVKILILLAKCQTLSVILVK